MNKQWEQTKSDLKLQMTPTAFDAHVSQTEPIRVEGDCWYIAVPNPTAQDWLEHRLYRTVEQALTYVVGQPVELVFVCDDSPKPVAPILPPPPLPVPVPASLNGKAIVPDDGLAGLNYYEAKRSMGYWLPEFDYDHRFWRVYLGRGYDFWRYLVAFWLKQNREQFRRDLSKKSNQGWTPPFRLSYRNATQAMGNSNSAVVPGGIYECHRSLHMYQARDYGVPLLGKCCQTHQPCRWEPKENGGRCYYWRPGLLQQLHDERLIAVEVSPGRQARVQVLRVLPLLTPWQVESGLPDNLTDTHEKWLDTFGQHFELNPARWAAIDAKRLAATMRRDEVVLHGEPPRNPLLGTGGNDA